VKKYIFTESFVIYTYLELTQAIVIISIEI